MSLRAQAFRAGHGGAGHRNDEVGALAAAGQHIGDDAALAVTDDPRGARFGTGGEPAQGACRVRGEVLQRGRGVVPFGCGRPPVVVTQDGDSAARQVVGRHEKRLVAEQLLVAVLSTRTGHQYDGRKGPLSGGQSQRAGEGDACCGVVEHHLLRGVGVGRPGCLRSCAFLLAARESQRQPEPVLTESPCQGVCDEGAFVGHAQGGRRDGESRSVEGCCGGGQPFGVLVGAVHDGGVDTFVFGDVEYQCEFLRTDRQGAVPVARHLLSVDRRACQQGCHER